MIFIDPFSFLAHSLLPVSGVFYKTFCLFSFQTLKILDTTKTKMRWFFFLRLTFLEENHGGAVDVFVQVWQLQKKIETVSIPRDFLGACAVQVHACFSLCL